MQINKTIKIDVISDIACPWCYIGKHRLESAIKQWENGKIEVNWHPYELNPNMPKEGVDRKTYLINKFGIADRPDIMKRIHDAATEEGITLNFGDKWLGVDTLPLHQLLEVAGVEGFKGELKERLFYAYFTENLHLNKEEVLQDIMKEFGWEPAKTTSVLNDNKILQKVKEDIQNYKNKGVSGVPFFIINDTYGVSGAQPKSVFLEIFEKVNSEKFKVKEEGNTCSEEGDCPV